MPTVTTKTQADLVAGQGAAVQASASGLVDLSVGSVTRAILEAVAGVALWLQGLVLTLLANTRAATSKGADLDSWMADYGLSRLAATVSSGSLTFSRFSTTGTANVPAGATAQTAGGTQTFSVMADVTNPAWNAGLNAYVMGVGTGSVVVKAQSLSAAAAANALTGTVTVITGALPGVDTVTNAAPFTGGSDAESDANYRTRFVGYLATLSKATVAAVTAAARVQSGLFLKVIENQAAGGSFQLGNFLVLVDDGTGSPPSPLLASVAAAVDPVRPIGSTFNVLGPSVVTAAVAMTVTVPTGYVKASVGAAVQAAITSYVNAQSFGATVPYTKLAQVAYEASPGVQNVSAVTLNGGTSDITATGAQLIRAGAITVTTP